MGELVDAALARLPEHPAMPPAGSEAVWQRFRAMDRREGALAVVAELQERVQALRRAHSYFDEHENGYDAAIKDVLALLAGEEARDA